MEEMKFTVEKKPRFGYGDKFYMVEPIPRSSGEGDYSMLKSKCPACGDTCVIEGIGLDGSKHPCVCPVCRNGGGAQNYLKLMHWIVSEYIVLEVGFIGPSYKTNWRGQLPVPFVSVRGFYSSGNDTKYVYVTQQKIDAPIDEIDLASYAYRDHIFSTRKKAEEVFKKLTVYDISRLEKFNAQFGTEHKYPFEYPAKK